MSCCPGCLDVWVWLAGLRLPTAWIKLDSRLWTGACRPASRPVLLQHATAATGDSDSAAASLIRMCYDSRPPKSHVIFLPLGTIPNPMLPYVICLQLLCYTSVFARLHRRRSFSVPPPRSGNLHRDNIAATVVADIFSGSN